MSAAISVRPELDGQTEIPLRCLDLAGVVELDGDGVPVRFRRRCRNRQCCPPRDGFVPVHRWDLRNGTYVTEYAAQRPISEFVDTLRNDS